MPLSPPAERGHLHSRRYEFRGYRRRDGLWDIEGRLADTKAYAFRSRQRGEIAAGEPVHDMSVRLTVDDDFVVREAEAVTDVGPFSDCPAIAPAYRKLVGRRLGAGWRRRVRELFAGREGCTHLSEMLGAMATAAFQTMYPVLRREGRTKPAHGANPLVDTCYAFRGDGPLMQRAWADHASDE